MSGLYEAIRRAAKGGQMLGTSVAVGTPFVAGEDSLTKFVAGDESPVTSTPVEREALRPPRVIEREQVYAEWAPEKGSRGQRGPDAESPLTAAAAVPPIGVLPRATLQREDVGVVDVVRKITRQWKL